MIPVGAVEFITKVLQIAIAVEPIAAQLVTLLQPLLKTAWAVLTQQRDPTAEEWAMLDKAADVAYAALRDAVKARRGA